MKESELAGVRNKLIPLSSDLNRAVFLKSTFKRLSENHKCVLRAGLLCFGPNLMGKTILLQETFAIMRYKFNCISSQVIFFLYNILLVSL